MNNQSGNSPPVNGNHQELLKNAFLQIRKLRQQLQAQEEAAAEPIAIIGMACRFPGGANNPEAYWQLLYNGIDAVSAVPPDRWDVDAYYDPDPDTPGKIYTKHGAFLEAISEFDPLFFGISPREAASLDPQQRLLLEVSWEAIENAACSPASIQGSQTGVFIGLGTDDYSKLSMNSGDPTLIDGHAKLGNARSFAAGRIAYALGLHGPAMQLDTTCSSSSLSIHLACQSLRLHESDMALAGGVNLILAPAHSISFCKLKALSPTGRCHTFDAKADGYVRGEGCGMVVLKRLSDALADKDNILALIRGSAVNHDGRSNGLTAPNGQAQERLIRQALKNAGLTPDQIQYVEAHGTGTSLGDPIEALALAKALQREQPTAPTLLLGSVKTNFGHLETAAGVAGLMKVVLALQHGEIPPHLHFEQANPYIPWDRLSLNIPVEPTPWPDSGQNDKRRAGLSSFGMSGTNVHVILEAAPEMKLAAPKAERPLHLLCLSAKEEGALQALAGRYAHHLSQRPELRPGDICHTAAAGRNHHEARLTLVAESTVELQQKLVAFNQGQAISGVHQEQSHDRPRIAFLFTGQGSQYPGMGQALYEQEPTFRRVLEECQEHLRPHMDRPLLEILYPSESAAGLIHQTAYTQPALFALEYALAQLWRRWGIEPEAVLGHSVGEYVAACVAGVFSLEEGLRLIAMRGRLMQQLPAKGSMAAVFAGSERVAAAIQPYAATLSLAAYNSPQNVVISGLTKDVRAVSQQLQAEGIQVRELTVSHAFHSPLMEPMLDEFEAAARQINYRPPRCKLVANVSGKVARPEEITEPGYWRQQIRSGVRFSQGMASLVAAGCDTYIEIGPRPTLLGLGQQSVAKATNYHWVPSLRPGQNNWQTLLTSLGSLYRQGAAINWEKVNEGYGYRKISLPTYPFQRQRYWLGVSLPGQSTVKETAYQTSAHPLLGRRLELPLCREIRYEGLFSPQQPVFLDDHRLFGVVVVPAAWHISLVLSGMEAAFGQVGCQVNDFIFPQSLVVEEAGERMQLVLQPEEVDGYRFQVLSRQKGEGQTEWTTHAGGEVRRLAESGPQLQETDKLAALRQRCDQKLSGDDFYRPYEATGYEWGPAFRWIEKVWRGEGEAVGRLVAPESCRAGLDEYILHPGLVDSCFHVLAGCRPDLAGELSEGGYIYIPFSIEEIRVYGRHQPGQAIWVQAQIRPDAEQESGRRMIGDIYLYDEAGRLLVAIEGFEGRKASHAAVKRSLQQDSSSWLYTIAWEESPGPDAAETNIRGQRWLILGNPQGLGQRLAGSIGPETVLVETGPHYRQESRTRYQVDPTQPKQLSSLLQMVGSCDGIIHLWGIPDNNNDLTTTAEIEASQRQSCGSLLHLIQALADMAWSPSPCLWLVTAGAQSVAQESQTTAQLMQTTLWGLGRVLGLEQPEWHCRRLDLDPEMTTGIDMLLAELAGSDEDEIAYRNGRRYLPRLTRCQPQPEEELTIRADGSYLISGGLGALGLQVAQWLQQQGARRLVLVGRSQPSPAATTVIESLRDNGCQVQVVSADITEVEAVAAAIDEAGPALRGIIHAAGRLDDGLLLGQEWAQFWGVLAAKVAGGWHLHRLTAERELDFFVNFSSMVSLVGAMSQGNYAAANTFLDGLAYYRRGQGLAGTSINWGPWSEAGMAADLNRKQQARLAERGISSLTPEQGLRILEQLLAGETVQTAVMPVTWRDFLSQWNGGGLPSMLHLFAAEKASAKASDPWLRQALEQVEVEEWQTVLLHHIRSELARTLGLGSAEQVGLKQRLFDLGLDSLMAVELKNRLEVGLGCSLRSTLIFDYPMAEALVNYLLENVLISKPANTATAVNEVAIDDEVDGFLSEIEQLSDDEITQQLLGNTV